MSRRAFSESPLDYAQMPERWPETRLRSIDLAPYFAREFARTLRAALEGHSPKVVATEAGIARSALYNYLDGRRWASLDVIGALATVLDANFFPTIERQHELSAELAAELALDPMFAAGAEWNRTPGHADFVIGGVAFDVKARRTGSSVKVTVTPLVDFVYTPGFLVTLKDSPAGSVNVEILKRR